MPAVRKSRSTRPSAPTAFPYSRPQTAALPGHSYQSSLPSQALPSTPSTQSYTRDSDNHGFHSPLYHGRVHTSSSPSYTFPSSPHRNPSPGSTPSLYHSDSRPIRESPSPSPSQVSDRRYAYLFSAAASPSPKSPRSPKYNSLAFTPHLFNRIPLLPEIRNRDYWEAWKKGAGTSTPHGSHDGFIAHGTAAYESIVYGHVIKGTPEGPKGGFLHDLRELLFCPIATTLICTNLGLHDDVATDLDPLRPYMRAGELAGYHETFMSYFGALFQCDPFAAQLWGDDLVTSFYEEAMELAAEETRSMSIGNVSADRLRLTLDWTDWIVIEISDKYGSKYTTRALAPDIYDATREHHPARQVMHPPVELLYPREYAMGEEAWRTARSLKMGTAGGVISWTGVR